MYQVVIRFNGVGPAKFFFDNETHARGFAASASLAENVVSADVYRDNGVAWKNIETFAGNAL